MSLFGSRSETDECGVIIDVGSASIGIAIVVSENITEKMEVLWSAREYQLIRSKTSVQDSVKNINTALVNALLELGGSGLKALHEHNPKLSPTYVQVAICAPWSYTVTKSINYEDEHPFEVDKSLLRQLIENARKETMSSMLDGKLIEDLGLRMITDVTIDVEINGYSIKDPVGHSGRTISMSHINAVAEERILATLEDSIIKILPKVQIEYFSFMYIFYQALKELHPDTSEICLIDITNEATEIGIVRDNVLRYTTHVPYGMYSLARDIAEATGIPNEEAYSYIKDGRDLSEMPFGEKKAEEIQKVFDAYEDKIAALFQRTGDSLSIPKTLFLHTSKNTEEFFAEHLKSAAKKATGTQHSLHLFTSELLGSGTMQDTALALSAYNFHTRELNTDLELV